MADQELRDDILTAIFASPALVMQVHNLLIAAKQRSKEDIERSWQLCGDPLQPKISSDRIVWHTNTFGEVLSESDIMSIIRDSARG